MRGITVIAVLTMSLGAAVMASAQDALGRVITIAPARVEPEADRTYVGNDERQLTLLDQYAQMSDADAIAALTAMGDDIPPPLLLELGRRQIAADAQAGSYSIWLGVMRMRAAGGVCSDTSAPQFRSIIMMRMAGNFPDAIEIANQDAAKRVAFERILAEDAIAADRTSAWWICSHGMTAMFAAMDGRPISLAEWHLGEDRRTQVVEEMRASLGEWLADNPAQ